MPQPSKKTEKININDERDVRLHKLAELQTFGINPYPSLSERKHTVLQALQQPESSSVVITGRIMTKREMGKLTFCHIQDESGKMQAVIRQDIVTAESYALFNKKVDIGDFIEFHGERCTTKTGEASVMVHDWKFLAKAVRPLPDKFHGISDEEIKLRKRYLDLLFDPETKELFRRKTRFWQSMRAFLLEQGFLEVETPVLETTAGGADATPFVTHHNALDMPVYLRISMGELWQKRLMVGGLEKTFEIGRQFRNEGMSREHLQDYTQMEFYWAFADYRKGMELVERMYKYVVQETYGSLQIKQIGNFTDIDLSQPWKEIDYVDTIEQMTGLNVLTASEQELQGKLQELHVTYEAHEGKGRLMDSLWKYCRKQIKGPVFLVRLPVDVSPLAKRTQDNLQLTERYQVIIAGTELGNGYSELNDPVDQMHRFQEQARLREAGDAEAQMYDADFVEALEYGMPPTTGFGVSERLFSFLENRPIRECVLFPLMHPESHTDTVGAKSKKTKVAHIVLLDTHEIPQWSKLNAAAHLSASFAAREGKQLIHINSTKTLDGEVIPTNIQHAIIMKMTEDRSDLLALKRLAESKKVTVTCFTEEMRNSPNDLKVKEEQESKTADDILFLGILLFGEKRVVEELTDKFKMTT